jgi:hypothetical protein
MKFVIAAALVILAASPALAENFYIVQDTATKRCTVTTLRPVPGTSVLVGDTVYATRSEAETAMRGMVACATE